MSGKTQAMLEQAAVVSDRLQAAGIPNPMIVYSLDRAEGLRARLDEMGAKAVEVIDVRHEPRMGPPHGNCPIQAYGTYRGWLVYFRARSVWDLSAWRPSKWDSSKSPSDDQALSADAFFAPDASVDESDEDETMPQWEDVRAKLPLPRIELVETYPGWWQVEYAQAMLDWAMGKLMVKIDEAIPS